MATATSTETSTIKPAGGGDYTTLASWWTAKKGGGGSANVAAWAECYSGGDMGVVDIDGASYTPTADYYTRIYAEPDSWQDGSNSAIQGARLAVTDGVGISVSQRYTRVEGIRIALTASSVNTDGIRGTDAPDTLLSGCVLLLTEDGKRARGIVIRTIASAVTGIVVRNNLIYGDGTSNEANGINFSANTGAGNLTAIADNNSVSQISTDAAGYGILFYAGTAVTCTITSRNNISTGNTKDFYGFVSGGVVNTTQTYCLSEDDTADDWGGAGNLINQTAADVFENVASDLRLKAVSPACSAAISLASTFTTDAIQAARKAIADGNVGWDMGALTTGGNPWYYYAQEETAA